MVKIKRKSILRTLLCAVFALCFAVGLSSLFANGTTAYAAAVTTPKYAIPITYSTWYSRNGGKSITGGGTALSFSARIGQYNSSTYSVSLYGSGASGTATWDGYIRSSTVTIVLSSSSGTPTVSVVNSAGKGVGSGTKTITLTGLADGTYTASFGASGGWLVNARQYDSVGFNASFTFTVDQSVPTVSGASTSSTGKYTNSSTYVSASDSGSGVSALYVKSPNSSSYLSAGTSTTIASTATNGLYSFYAKDKAGNTSRTYFLYLDTVKPTGTIKNSNGTEITGSYMNQTFSYSATDSGSGISYLQYKKPSSSSWLTYTSGTSISSSAASGTYQFRAVDKAGNISATKSITLDSSKPTMTLYSGDVSVSNGFKSIANYIKATATDSGSGVKTIYVKKPGASSYTEYASGTQLTADGAYSFYCVDNAGNASQTYTISMDHTRPTITSSVGGFGKTLKDGFTDRFG